MKRVLLTGATGFIGRACIAPLLERGYEVHAVGNERSGATGVVWHRCDLLAPDAPNAVIANVRPSHLLHLAWYAVPGAYWTSPLNLAWVRASLALHDAFVAAGGTRAVYAGSAAEYEWGLGTCHEDTTPLRPATYYGICKHALAQVIAADAAIRSTSVAWARFFFLYGPHEYRERLVASVICDLLHGRTARCSSGEQRRDFMYVDDAAAATVALLDSEVTGAVNIASGQAIAVRFLVELVAERVGPSAHVDFGAKPPDPVSLIAADVRRLREEVGVGPPRAHRDRIDETIAWWRGQSI